MNSAPRIRMTAWALSALGALIAVGIGFQWVSGGDRLLGPLYQGFIGLLIDRGLGLTAVALPPLLAYAAWALWFKPEPFWWNALPARLILTGAAVFCLNVALCNSALGAGRWAGFFPFLAHGAWLRLLGTHGHPSILSFLVETAAAGLFFTAALAVFTGRRFTETADAVFHRGPGGLLRGFAGALFAVLKKMKVLVPVDAGEEDPRFSAGAAEGRFWVRRLPAKPGRDAASFPVTIRDADETAANPVKSSPPTGAEIPEELRGTETVPVAGVVAEPVRVPVGSGSAAAPGELDVEAVRAAAPSDAEAPDPPKDGPADLVIRRLDATQPQEPARNIEGEVDFDLTAWSFGNPGAPASDEPAEAAEAPVTEAVAHGTAERPPTTAAAALLRGKKEVQVINAPGKPHQADLRADAKALAWSPAVASGQDDDFLRRTAATLEGVLRDFGIEARVVEVATGPVITRFEMAIESGVHVSKVSNLSDNIAMSLAAVAVRIVAPIPGKSLIGVEIPNRTRHSVRLRDVVESHQFRDPKQDLPVALGKSILGEPVVTDLSATPHLLIAGATGSGKSVCVNALLSSLLVRRSPAELRLILIDPKMVELALYNGVPHLLTPVITDSKLATRALKWVVGEMEARYLLLQDAGVRNIKGYNQKAAGRGAGTLPYIVVVMDEFADLMMIARKEVEDSVRRLSAMSRAVGIHLVLATQRPSVDVITGVIKNNLPSRIAFQVTSKVDSRTILDQGGADKLLGRGDMLFQSAAMPVPERLQGAFLSDEEVQSLVDELAARGAPRYVDEILAAPDFGEDEEGADEEVSETENSRGKQDPLFEKAWEFAQERGVISSSIIQRRLSIGYNRAARIVEAMEALGLVAPADGAKPRRVISAGRV